MRGLDLREQRAWRSGGVSLLLEGMDLVKLGWETVDRMWEEGSLGGSAWLGSWNWARLGWIELEWCVGLGCWDQKCFQQKLRAKEATSVTKQK